MDLNQRRYVDTGRRWGGSDGGQSALVVLVVVAVLGVALTVALVDMAATAQHRLSAQTAADAAALASVGEGRKAAVELAALNGATIVSWRRGPGPFDVTVTVRIGDATATARASNAP